MSEAGDDGLGGAKGRLAFEAEQPEGGQAELADLLGRLNREREAVAANIRRLDQGLADVETLLRPVRARFAAFIPPEVGVLDTQVGQCEERIATLQRLRKALEHRDELARRIDELSGIVAGLTGDLDAKYEAIPFERLSDLMSDGINGYLNRLKAGEPARWPHDPVQFDLGRRSFHFWATSIWATSMPCSGCQGGKGSTTPGLP